eukprot:5362353-Alexandrium_andersonii.AAC.1
MGDARCKCAQLAVDLGELGVQFDIEPIKLRCRGRIDERKVEERTIRVQLHRRALDRDRGLGR